jgi:predicted AlkP superfamily pyrophosphatase or phosphodiesterase
MKDILETLIFRIKEHRLMIPNKGDPIVFPDYDGFSIANLPASICKWLDVPFSNGTGLNEIYHRQIPEEYQHVILLVLDGLGLKLLRQFTRAGENEGPKSTWNHFLGDAFLAPLTSVVPSTTSSALTTLWTGVSPAVHGILGYELWLKEYGVVANMISQSPAMFSGEMGGLRKAGFNPENFLPVPTLGPHLNKFGVKPFAFLHSSIAHSGLSAMHSSQVEVTAFHTLSDLFVTLRNIIAAHSSSRTFSYVYWASLDTLSHHFGPEDERMVLEFTSFGLMLERFLLMLQRLNRQKTLLIITADHGLIPTSVRKNFDVKFHPELSTCLTIQPTGENRLPYLFVRPGREETIRSYIQETWGDQFRLIKSDEMIKAGMFGRGEFHHRLRDRVGDWIVIPQGNAYWWWGEKADHLLGRHGGLSEEEMIVPLIIFP